MKQMVSMGLAVTLSMIAGSAFAQNSFLNGGFETGTLANWTVGGGDRSRDLNGTLSASRFLPGGNLHAATGFGSASNQVSVVTPGADPYVGSVLNRVFNGGFSARIGDLTTGGYAGAIRQEVTNYGATTLSFSWAAVLEPQHNATDSSFFSVRVVDVTNNTVLDSTVFAGFPGSPTQGIFQTASSGYIYAPWQSVSVNTVIGNTYAIELFAADCEPTGHLGYAYLDGFGSVVGGGGDDGTVGGGGSTVPVPGTLALLGLGAFGLRLRRKLV